MNTYYCEQCGAPLPGISDAFCMSCGAAVKRPGAAAQPMKNAPRSGAPRRRSSLKPITVILLMGAVAAVMTAVIGVKYLPSIAKKNSAFENSTIPKVSVPSVSDREALMYKCAHFSAAHNGILAAVMDDRTVLVSGGKDRFDNLLEPVRIPGWEDIVSVAVCDKTIYGLNSSGLLFAEPVDSDDWGKGYYTEDLSSVDGRLICIDASNDQFAAVGTDGKLKDCDAYSKAAEESWTDLVQVSVSRYLMAGLRSDGSVVARCTEGSLYHYAACATESWSGIVAVDTGWDHVVGLRADGKVLVAGNDSRFGQCAVDGWENITAVAAGMVHTVGLRADGTVAAVGDNRYGQCDVDSWRDVVAVNAGTFQTMGLRSDGTILCAGKAGSNNIDSTDWSGLSTTAAEYARADFLSQMTAAKKRGYDDVVPSAIQIGSVTVLDPHSISCGKAHTVALKSDGTVLATGDNTYGQCNVSGWNGMLSVAAGLNHTVGLYSDGTVYAVGDNSKGQCDVQLWRNVISICAGGNQTIGFTSEGRYLFSGQDDFSVPLMDPGKKGFVSMVAGMEHFAVLSNEIYDMTVAASGSDECGQIGELRKYAGVAAIAAGWYHSLMVFESGRVIPSGEKIKRCVSDTEDWTDIVRVAGGNDTSFGLRADGTVVCATIRPDSYADCEAWTHIIDIAAGDDFVVGLRADGTVVAAGDKASGQCDTYDWFGVWTLTVD